MQLTAKEQAIKRHLIGQLRGSVLLRQTFSGLSYAEKKHVIEELDRDFLEAEVQKMRARGKRHVWWLIPGMAAVAGLMIFTSYASGYMTQNYWEGVVDMLLVGALAINAYVLYQAKATRRFIYEGLRILAGSTNEAAQNLAQQMAVNA